MDEIDLEHGDPAAAEAIQSRGADRAKAARQARRSASDTGDGSSSSKSRGDRSSGGTASDTRMASQFRDVFERLADYRNDRDDPELADAIRKDAKPLGRGIITLTARVPFLRGPILAGLNILEFVLAAVNTGSILWHRHLLRRERIAYEQQMQVAEVVDGEPVQ